MAKYTNAELASYILECGELDNEIKSQIIGILRNNKKYGLVWEDSPEEAYNMLSESLPILVEDKSKRIVSSALDAPSHSIIEGDNLHALNVLTYTHEHCVDVIYIDPPYNSGARDWRYNNDYVDANDGYRHSKWLSFMKHRLIVAKRLLRQDESVLIVTIDEKEYLRLGLLLEEIFPEERIQMISTNIHPGGVARDKEFARSDEYIFFVFIGESGPQSLPLEKDWLFGIESTSREGVHWRALLRSGSNDSRLHSPGCFYPIFVAEDGSKIISVGEPLALGIERNCVVAPEGQRAIFPIHANGSEGCWQCSPSVLKELCEKGYVKLGGFTPRGMSINYLAKGEQKKVEDGLFRIVGKNPDGSLILDDEGYSARFIPTTQWNIKSHDALRNGTGLLNKILGPKVFPYPKSLYAVRDALRFFVSDKPDAVIIDFFAGSGTTLHATMLLNAEDCGNRQCILVTNNENNICEEVTYERNKRVILGYTDQKGEHVDGFLSNSLRYFKIDFVPRSLTHQSKRDFVKRFVDTLCFQENCYTEVDAYHDLSLSGKRDLLRVFSNEETDLIVVFDSRVIPFISSEIRKIPTVLKRIAVYVFADGSYPYTEDFKGVVDRISLIALPSSYLQALKYNLPPEKEQSITNENLSTEEIRQMLIEANRIEEEGANN